MTQTAVLPDITTTNDAANDTDFAERLRQETTAVRLRRSKWGVSKTLDKQQKQMAANPFGADGTKLAASKKLVDVGHPKFKAVTKILNLANQYWQQMTVPYPEDGIRLIRTEQVTEFDAQIARLQSELDGAVAQLNHAYWELRRKAQRDLGSLFNPADYPDSLDGMFAICVEYPSVEPDERLQRLNPALYEREQRRIQERFDEAVRLAEEAFLSELAELVQHLCGRLEGGEDGASRIFRDSAVTNLTEFFERFRQLNIGSNADLDRLVAQAQGAVRNVTPQRLRDNDALRSTVRFALSSVQQSLDQMMVDRPQRAIRFED
jgi:hypothetical protein